MRWRPRFRPWSLAPTWSAGCKSIRADAAGATTATHTLEELRYQLYGGEIIVPIAAGAAAGTPLVLETTAVGRVTAPLSAEDAHLQVGDHAFGVDYGRYAMAALDQAVRARFGTDLRGALGQLVDCAGMAASVSNRCLLGACVGHQATLAAICDAGLDLGLRGRHGSHPRAAV